MSLRRGTSVVAIFAAAIAAWSIAAASPPQDSYLGEPLLTYQDGVMRRILLPPTLGHPRNSEGDLIRLRDGRILLVYTHFVGDGSHDHATAHLAGRFSSDNGETWTDEDTLILPNEGQMNVMSVSLQRLQDGRIAMFYLVKNSPQDCRPYMRISSDECKTWGDRVQIIEKVGYNVLNNDRVVQLKSGRIVVPVAISNILRCYLSDDNGKTWRRGKEEVIGVDSDGERYVIQEPGIVPLSDGRMLMHCRTDQGCHHFTYSSDEGETWSKLEPSALIGPRTAAAIKRIPTTGDLLCLWNFGPEDKRSADMQYTIAVSNDEGKTWKKVYVLEDRSEPYNRYCCYCAILFVDDHVLLAHCNGHWGRNVHEALQITRFPILWLYKYESPTDLDAPSEFELPNVLLIGDSISIGYTETVRKKLQGEANVLHPPTNCSTTTNGVRELKSWLGNKAWDVVCFNFGLHDTSIKKDGKYRCPIDQYEENLTAIVRELEKTGATLLWCSTTPIPQERTDRTDLLPRFDRDVVRYNAVAKRIMDTKRIKMVDLYSWTRPKLDQIQIPADIHFTPQGYRAIAGHLSHKIWEALVARSRSPMKLEAAN
jgi:sialidase-1